MKLFYFNRRPNFGDELNISLLQDYFNYHVEYAEPENAELVFIGSLLESFLTKQSKSFKDKVKELVKGRNTPLVILGTGLIREPDYIPQFFKRKVKVLSLRGEFTKGRMEGILNRKFNSLPLGDPGLLSSELVINRTKKKKKYKLGIIPHYVDKNNDKVITLHNSNSNSKIIDIQQSPSSFLNELIQCDLILSSAMHGLIAADSLGIPNMRLILSDKIVGGNYKYNDYYSVFGMDDHPALDLSSSEAMIKTSLLDEIYNNYKVNQRIVDQIKTNLIKLIGTIK